MADKKIVGKCIGDFMRGKKFSKLERKLNFCSIAKMCWGKFTNIEEAKKDCLKKHPEWAQKS